MTRLVVAPGRLGRHKHRDATLTLLGYRRGFRVSELVALHVATPDAKSLIALYEKLSGKKATGARPPVASVPVT